MPTNKPDIEVIIQQVWTVLTVATDDDGTGTFIDGAEFDNQEPAVRGALQQAYKCGAVITNI